MTRMEQADLFYGHGTDNPGSEAQWLLLGVLAQAGINEVADDTPLDAVCLERLETLLQRRIHERIPVAYLLHEAWFAGLAFFVDERVLVPRSPIAELIENRFDPLLNAEPATILDLCCGSGCIGIACALAFPDSRVVLADISPEALEVASINIEKYDLQDRVTTVQSDLFAGVSGTFDLIVSNPPYVPADEYRELPDEYWQEPQLGLVSSGEGLDIPRQILAQSADFLTREGHLILETGYTWQALDASEPDLPFLWLDFEYGGEGVCLLSRDQLPAA